MYKLRYLRLAKEDIYNIMYYISHDLKNQKAALGIIKKLMKEMKNITVFPYSNSIYNSLKPLEYNYRKAKVKNFIVFYIIDEISKTIIITRIIHSKRNIDKILRT